MAGGYGQRMRLRLFLEGVEVPVIGAQVQVNPNSPAVASIQIPPLPEGMRFLPRTLVHLFFLDFYEVQSPFPVTTTAVNSATNQSPTAHENMQGAGVGPVGSGHTGDSPDLRNAGYKLLFGGEVAGFQWTKSQNSRALVLQCQDWSNYWDYAQQWNNTDLFGPGIKALFSGGGTSVFTDFLSDEGSAIIQLIQSPSVRYPALKGLLGGIVHLLESIGGVYDTPGVDDCAGSNMFFSLAELRLHITQMITAFEDDPTSSRLLSNGYDSLLGRTLGNLGQQVSIRQAINALQAAIFHETYAQCCPAYTAGSGNNPSGSVRTDIRKDPANAFIATNADALISSINTLLGGLTAGTAEVADVKLSLSSMRTLCKDTLTRITGQSVQSARSFYASALTALGQAQAAALAKEDNFFGDPPASITAAITTPLNAALSQLQRASIFEVVTSTKSTVPARLNQQIFRPDVWFTAPPRCNVIFPENYHSLSYARSFLAEPTRLLLKTNNEFYGEDELFDAFYYAPKGFTVQTGGRELQDLLNNGIFDHELFTGILPVFEKMGELNIFGARSGTVDAEPVQKVGLAQRSTNFLYFKYRFAARQLQLTGKFNPYLACGFPALVIDKYVDADALSLREQLIAQNGGTTNPDINQLLGTHFLCNLTEVSHSVDQGSGSTSLNCGYARQPDEGTEFLGVVRPGQAVHKRSDQDATRVTVVATAGPPAVNSMGPNQGVITAVQNVSQAYKGRTLPLYQGPVRTGTNQARINVVVGVTQAASAFSADVVTWAGGDPTQVLTFSAYKVTESVPRYTRTVVDMPMEEYIRPGWYGDCWHPAIIGATYAQFFQTGAITDQQQIDSANGASIGVPFEQAQKALQDASKALDAGDPAAAAPGLLAVETDSSIAAAVAFIVSTYSYIKQNGLDTDDFIRTYTWRPIATMVDLFGTSDLALDTSGLNVISGIEGFHSRAFGPYDNLFGLTTPSIENILGIKRGTAAAQRGDTRKRKQEAVQSYVSAIQFARAILG